MSFTSNLDQHLGEHISQVGRCLLFGYPGHSGSHNFSALILENNYVIIIQCRLRSRNILIDRSIVSEHVGWSIYRDIKHTQLVTKGFDQFSCCLESDELTQELASLDSAMLLTIP